MEFSLQVLCNSSRSPSFFTSPMSGVSLVDLGMWEANCGSGIGRGDFTKGHNLLHIQWMVVVKE